MVASAMARRSLLPRYGATAREDREMTVGLLTYQDPWRGRSDLEHPEVGTEMDPHPEHVRFEANLRGATRVLLAQERPGLFVADRGRLVGLVMPSRDLSRASLDALGAALPAVDLLATVREPGDGPAVTYRIRVSALDPGALIELLEARGYGMVTATKEREDGVAPSAAASSRC